jgi:hypothetical protein
MQGKAEETGIAEENKLVRQVFLAPQLLSSRVACRRGEVSNLTVRISNYDFFNSTNDVIYRSTTDANYTLTRESGPVYGTNLTRADLPLVVRWQRANTVLFAAFPEMPVFLTDPRAFSI